jgi:tripartite-type tricarboxylate transporter receptor subunit TctC
MDFGSDRRVAIPAMFFLVLLLSGCSRAQSTAKEEAFPTKPITYLILYDPGGQSDRRARQQQPMLERILKQKVLIEYKVGGGGAVGLSELVRSRPDGYTMSGFNLPPIILQPLQQQTGYRTNQLVPVALFERTPLGLAVLKTSRYRTLQEVLDAAKERPGEFTLGGTNIFSAQHMMTLWLEKSTGTKFNYLPFPGGAAQQVPAFLGGHVDAILGNSDDLIRNKEQTRLLAIAHEERLSDCPDAPTFKEAGIEMVIGIDRGVAVPPDTPAHVIRTLEAAFLEVARDPATQDAMKSQGFIPMAMGSQESRAYIERMTAFYTDLSQLLKK